jgi:hypothetical protein
VVIAVQAAIAEGAIQLSGNNLFHQMNFALAHANSLFGRTDSLFRFSGMKVQAVGTTAELMSGGADF